MLRRINLTLLALMPLGGCVNMRLESYWRGDYKKHMAACAEVAQGEVAFIGETASSGADPLTVAAMARSSRRKLATVPNICKAEPFWIFADAYAQAVEGAALCNAGDRSGRGLLITASSRILEVQGRAGWRAIADTHRIMAAADAAAEACR